MRERVKFPREQFITERAPEFRKILDSSTLLSSRSRLAKRKNTQIETQLISARYQPMNINSPT